MRKKFVSNLAKNNNYKNYKKSNFVKYQKIKFHFGKKIIIRKKKQIW